MTQADIVGLWICYGFVSAVIFIGATVVAADGYGDGRRRAARIALTCWAWPFWFMVWILKGLVWLLREAR